MSIPQNIIEEVQDKTDIVELVSSYIPLKKRGRNFTSLCPFHSEKTPSFSVSPDRQIFHCFGCGIGGGVIRFVMEYEKISFPEAVDMLAKRLGINIPRKASPFESQKSQGYSINKEACQYFHRNLFNPRAKRYLDYLQKRGVKTETIKQFNIGLALPGYTNLTDYLRSEKGVSVSLLDKFGLVTSTSKGNFIDFFRDRIVFPIADVKNRVLAFGARTISDNQKGVKYINTPQTPLYHKGKSLFGINLARDSIIRNDSCLIVEGYMDMILPFQEGVTNIVASLGTALTEEQIRLIKRYTNNITLVYDSDSAGKVSSLRAIDLMIEAGLNVKAVNLPPDVDPDILVLKEGKDKFQDIINRAKDFFFYKLDILKENLDENKISQKSQILTEMVHTLSRFSNHIVKYEYLRKLAELLDTDEASLRLELQKTEQSKSTDLPKVRIEPNKESILAQEYLIKSILQNRGVLELVRKNIKASEFSDPVLCDIVKVCYDSLDSGAEVKLKNILGGLSKEAQDKAARFLSEEFTPEEEVLKESILDMKKRLKKKKRIELKEKIKQAEQNNDQDALLYLILAYQKLVKNDKEI